MKMGISTKWWVVIVVAVVLLYVIFTYNRFIGLEQGVNGAWSKVENQYQRQADLIPNLVSIVSSAVKVETKYVKEVVDARSKWQTAETQLDKDKAGVQMNNGIAALISAVATAENYPQLQANKQYAALMDEVGGTQNRITTERGRYIEAIQSYNIATMRFPAKIIASMFGFTNKDYYKAELSAMKTPVLGEGKLP